jgi:signal peptidase I
MRQVTLLALVAAGLVAGTASGTSGRAPRRSDLPTIERKLAAIGIHLRSGDRLFGTPSASMEPTLHCALPGIQCTAKTQDGVVSRPYGSASPRRGDLIAMQTTSAATEKCGSSGIWLKRVVGLPGEVWAEKDGAVYVDGKRLDEPYIKPAYKDVYTYSARRIPAGHYFVMGDNRIGSCDSRKWGPLPRSHVIGKLIATFWPLDRVRRL